MNEPTAGDEMQVKPNLFMVFDVESIGLHGEGFAVGYVVVNRAGETLEEDTLACDPGHASGTPDNRRWVLENVPAMEYDYFTPDAVRNGFWARWQHWKERGAVLVADCCWPVEARFLAACVDDAGGGREWDGPYPLHDLASVLLALGRDPLATNERLPNELPAHHPLNDARQSARLLAAALSAAPATTWAPDSPSAIDAGVRADGTVEDCVVETYLRPLEYVTRAPGFLRVVADDGATNVEIRVPDEALASLALSAAPAQEPLTMDQRYWLDRRTDIIAAMEAEGLQIWSDKDRVWLHRMSASPLPQEPQEGKALTDADADDLVERVENRVGMGHGAWDMVNARELARAIERELRGAQEGKAGEWIPVSERLPEVGTDCLVWTWPRWAKKPYAQIDRWDEQHEAPVSWSSATIPIGPGWDGSEFDDVIHWQPLPPPPSATLAASREGEQR